jgi:hypothetical protein
MSATELSSGVDNHACIPKLQNTIDLVSRRNRARAQARKELTTKGCRAPTASSQGPRASAHANRSASRSRDSDGGIVFNPAKVAAMGDFLNQKQLMVGANAFEPSGAVPEQSSQEDGLPTPRRNNRDADAASLRCSGEAQDTMVKRSSFVRFASPIKNGEGFGARGSNHVPRMPVIAEYESEGSSDEGEVQVVTTNADGSFRLYF